MYPTDEKTKTNKEQLTYEEIKDELNAIVEALGKYYNDVPLEHLPEIVSVAKSYGIMDNLYKIYEVSKDKDIPGAIGFEVAKMGGAAVGAWAGIQLGALSGSPLVALLSGAVGAFAGEKGVEKFEGEIRGFTNMLVGVFSDTSLDRFDFLEGADLTEEDLKNLSAIYGNDFATGHQTDYNPFIPRVQDPLVIDADKDGFISTVSLAESEVYFDLTGNGIKTKTSWIKGNDALLVYDENEDGKIHNIDEAFGNATTSGFDELRNTIDSNYDNKIDRRDILFNRLQLWYDYDQDLFTCKSFTTNKALHVKRQITHTEAKSGAEQKVA